MNVSWNDAAKCCEWLSSLHPDMAFALPTEAQWEYACRAGTTNSLYDCETSEQIRQYAQFGDDVHFIQGGGRLRPNAFGLYDTLGNVTEWCSNWLEGYGNSPANDPLGPLTPGKYAMKAVRGGSFLAATWRVRSSKRDFYAPDDCFFDRGFRVAAAISDREPSQTLKPLAETNALEFDGINDYVATPVKYDGSTPLTVEANVLISEWPDENKRGSEIVADTNEGGFSLGMTSEGFHFSIKSGDSYVRTTCPPDDRLLNRTVLLAGVLEGQSLKLFVDGQMVDETDFEEPFVPSPEKVSLGTSPGDGRPNDRYELEWAGRLYDVRISDIARYQTASDHGSQLDEHTIAFYRINEGSGDVLHDSSLNRHDATIVGAKWVGSVPVVPTQPDQQFGSNEWIDVIPLIDPELDRFNHISSGRNVWRIVDGELTVGEADNRGHKLIFPLDSDWKSFECEIDVTRQDGTRGFCLNLPSENGDMPVLFDQVMKQGVRIGQVPIGRQTDSVQVINDNERTVLHVKVTQSNGQSKFEVSRNDIPLLDWTGDRNAAGTKYIEGYPHDRRLSLVLFPSGGRRQFVFHRIRVRMLDGDTVTTLRPIPEEQSFPPGSDAYILTSDEYEWTEPVNLGPIINSSERDADPWVSQDGLTLLFASIRPGGQGKLDIYQSTRKSINDEWATPVNLGPPINSEGVDSFACMSADGLELYFHAMGPSREGLGSLDVWRATRDAIDSPWNEPVNLGPRINSSAHDKNQSLSADGLQLVFASGRDDKWQGWSSSRKSTDQMWEAARPLPGGEPMANGVQFLDSDQTILFGGRHELDPMAPMRVAHWGVDNTAWSGEVVLPWPFDETSTPWHPHFVHETNELYFDSDRPGGVGGGDLWVVRRVRKDRQGKKKFQSGEWIDLLSLVDPQEDRWDVTSEQGVKLTGRNEWRLENGELQVGFADRKDSKLIIPLDADWSAYEFDLEVTRKTGNGGFAVNIPTSRRDCPLSIDAVGKAGIVVGKYPDPDVVVERRNLQNDEKARIRFAVKRGEPDLITVWIGDEEEWAGKWSGDVEPLALNSDEGYDQPRRSSIYIARGSEFVGNNAPSDDGSPTDRGCSQ